LVAKAAAQSGVASVSVAVPVQVMLSWVPKQKSWPLQSA